MTELKLASPDRLQILLEFRAAVDCPADPALAAGTLPAGSTSVSPQARATCHRESAREAGCQLSTSRTTVR
jgi:hypothetical protein